MVAQDWAGRYFRLSASVLKRLKAMGFPGMTVHGFRSILRDWSAERTNYLRELAEAALAHVLADKTETSYQRGAMLEKRAKLMADWAKFCSTIEPIGMVVPIRRSTEP